MKKSRCSIESPDEFEYLGDIVGSGHFFDDYETLENYPKETRCF